MVILKEIYQTWRKFIDDDKEAFARLYEQNVIALYHYGTKLSPDEEFVKDAIQEVFLDLYLKRKKNKTNPERLRFYLLLALKRNLVIKIKKSRKLIHDETRISSSFKPEYSIETMIIEKEQENEINRRIAGFLRKLPSRQKEAIYLRFYECLDYPEIASLLSISIESVRKQVYRGIKTIRKLIGNEMLVLFMTFFHKNNP